jgi:hypothetical protein
MFFFADGFKIVANLNVRVLFGKPLQENNVKEGSKRNI